MDKGLLDIYSDYLISQSHYATATGLADLLNGEISHDKVSRFLRSEAYESKALWNYIKPEIWRHEKSKGGVLLLDDTISEKNYTDENAMNCWHFSHAKHRHVKGIHLLSCLVRYDDIAQPIGYEIIKKETQYSDLATRKLKRKAAIGKNDLFRAIIQQAADNQVYFDYILKESLHKRR